MFLMMNGARIAVGRGAAAIAMAAYRTSLQYANERPQGRKLSADGKKNPTEKQSLIIEHPDVRRMLLLQKAIVEGSLSLVLLASKYHDILTTAIAAAPLPTAILAPFIKRRKRKISFVVRDDYSYCKNISFRSRCRSCR